MSQRIDRMEAFSRRLAHLERENENLQAEIDDLHDVNETLRQRVIDLEEQTDLRHHIGDAKRLKVDERAEVCLKTLFNDARKQERAGRPGRASMDYNGARYALGGGLDNKQLLIALERAAELVESDAVRFIKETRVSPKNSRLVVDVDAGTIPTRYETDENSQTGGR